MGKMTDNEIAVEFSKWINRREIQFHLTQIPQLQKAFIAGIKAKERLECAVGTEKKTDC